MELKPLLLVMFGTVFFHLYNFKKNSIDCLGVTGNYLSASTANFTFNRV